MSQPVRPDTEIETRLKIVEIDGAVKTLKEDVTEIKGDVKRIFQRMDVLSQSESKYAGLLDLVNGNAQRSDLRWEQLQHDRREDLIDWKKWRESVDAYKTGVRLLVAAFVVLTSVIIGVGRYYFTELDGDRQANTNMINQSNSSQITRIEKNTDRLRAIENHLSRDPNFRPAQ